MKHVVLLILFIGGLSFWTQIQDKHHVVQTDIGANHDDTTIPTNIEDCVRQIDELWNDSAKAVVRTLDEKDFTAREHFGFGLWMRNNWGLLGSGRLATYFNRLGIYHPDDMSAIILTSYHRHLNDRPLALDEQIQPYKAIWRSSTAVANEK